MLHFHLSPEFRSGAARITQPFAPFADKLSRRFLSGARGVVIGGVAGWGAVVVAGAVLMANASHDGVGLPAAPAVAQAPAALVAKVEPTPVAVQPAKPAAPPVVAKTTQRVDMSPTAAIPAETPLKPKHRAHHKKPKDLDNPT